MECGSLFQKVLKILAIIYENKTIIPENIFEFKKNASYIDCREAI